MSGYQIQEESKSQPNSQGSMPKDHDIASKPLSEYGGTMAVSKFFGTREKMTVEQQIRLV